MWLFLQLLWEKPQNHDDSNKTKSIYFCIDIEQLASVLFIYSTPGNKRNILSNPYNNLKP